MKLQYNALLKLVALMFIGSLFGAGSLNAVPMTMQYQVADLGGGIYQYDFILVVDNNDNSYAAGQGWGWLIFGDQQSASSPLTGWTIGTGQLPVGPWTGMSSSGGGHCDCPGRGAGCSVRDHQRRNDHCS